MAKNQMWVIYTQINWLAKTQIQAEFFDTGLLPTVFLGAIYLGSTIWFVKSWMNDAWKKWVFIWAFWTCVSGATKQYAVGSKFVHTNLKGYPFIHLYRSFSIFVELTKFFRYLFFPYFICRLFIVSWVIYTQFFKSIENSPIFFVSKHIMFPRQLNTALKLGSAGCFFFDICLFELNFSWTLNAS